MSKEEQLVRLLTRLFMQLGVSFPQCLAVMAALIATDKVLDMANWLLHQSDLGHPPGTQTIISHAIEITGAEEV